MSLDFENAPPCKGENCTDRLTARTDYERGYCVMCWESEMSDKEIEQAFEEWFYNYDGINKHEGDAIEVGWLAGVQWAIAQGFSGSGSEQIEKLQAELDWHKKELARVDHALVDACDKANKLQADLKSVNFSYWKKCEEVNRLQQAVSEAREIFKDELVYCFPESNHWHGEIKKWLEKYGDNSNQ